MGYEVDVGCGNYEPYTNKKLIEAALNRKGLVEIGIFMQSVRTV